MPSGRNSGVLHAGFYYSPDSLKAKFTWRGNRLLTEYCEDKKIPLNKCGKLVVAKDHADHAGLWSQLLRRGRANGIPLEELSEQDAKAIEPRVKTCERALFSPATSTVDPSLVMQAMKKDAIDEGVQILCGARYLGSSKGQVKTTQGTHEVGYVVNAAGLYADRIARDYGFSEHYRILPFKGLYLYSSEPPGSIRTNIYPVPDPRIRSWVSTSRWRPAGKPRSDRQPFPGSGESSMGGWRTFTGTNFSKWLCGGWVCWPSPILILGCLR